MDYKKLAQFSSSDCSDALATFNDLKLLGHFPDVSLKSHSVPIKIVGPAYTVEFVFKSDTLAPSGPVNHVDTCPKGSVIVMKSPKTAPNAVWGGLMTARAVQVGAIGVVIEGRFRDLAEIKDFGFPVWATGQSTMGASPLCRPSTVGMPITIAQDSLLPILVKTGDIIIADEDGVVRVPLELVDRVYEACVKRVATDDKCMIDIKSGASIVETFAKYR